jgi:plastocyanin
VSGKGNHLRYRLRLRAGAPAIVALAASAAMSLGLLAPRPVAATPAGVTVSIAMGGCSAHSTAPRGMYCFQPSAVETPSGGTVTWQNNTDVSQTLMRCNVAACGKGNDGGSGKDSPFGASGATTVAPGAPPYAFMFFAAGTYEYYCLQTCGIGVVTVTATASPTPTPVQLSLGPVTAPSSTPPPAPTPSPMPTPSDTPSDTPAAVALTTPSSDTPSTPASLPLATDGNGNPGSGPPLVIIVLVILTLVAIGGGVLSFRLFRQ